MRRARIVHIGSFVVLALWSAIVILPVVWIGFNALRSSQEIVQNPFGLPWLFTGVPETLQGDVPPPAEAMARNFYSAWSLSGFSRLFLNSVLVTAGSLLGVLLIASMASYALVRLPLRLQRALLMFFLTGLMLPAQLLLIPLFFQFNTLSRWGTRLSAPFGYEMHLHDSLTGLGLIYIALAIPFTILVLYGFFRTLPSELREAAVLDGCGEFRVFWHVMLPLARPGLLTAAIFNFIGIWNEYLFALVFINSEDKQTLPLGLATVSIQAQYRSDFGLLFAGLVIVFAPTLLVYLLFQRHLTGGITAGALKG